MGSGSNRDALALFAVPVLLSLVVGAASRRRRQSSCVCCVQSSSRGEAEALQTVRSTLTGAAVMDAGTEDRGEDVFEVFVSPSDRFKFNAAHFIAFKGFRERLHGHNYSVGVTLIGRGQLGHDGYLLDFGDVKEVVGKLCKELNERFLLPLLSDAISITCSEDTCELRCEDGARFVMPRDDVAELPIVHSSAEELARYLWARIVDAFTTDGLQRRNIVALKVSVAEMPNQQATFKRYLSDASKGIGPSPSLPKGCAVGE